MNKLISSSKRRKCGRCRFEQPADSNAEKQFRKFWRMCYQFGGIAFVAGVWFAFLHAFFGDERSYLGAIALPLFAIWALMFSAGFLLWTLPAILSAAKSKATKLAIIVCQSIIAIIAFGLAKEAISSATGLPPQDFEVSVAALGLFFFFIILISLIAIFTTIFYIAVAVPVILSLPFIVYGGGLVIYIGLPILYVASKIFPTIDSSVDAALTRTTDKIESVVPKLKEFGAHWIGAFTMSIILIGGIYITYKDETLERVTRVLTYYLDYHFQDNNPHICEGRKANVHANSVVSYALPNEDLGIKILVTGLKKDTDCRSLSERF